MTTKNMSSRRTVPLSTDLMETIRTQAEISRSFECPYLFCTPNGKRVQRDNLRGRVWAPALVAAGIDYRPMSQTRHSFATTALSAGESPLWIAKIMGHNSTLMLIEVYSKYVQDANGTQDGSLVNALYSGRN
jgi:integrase